MLFMDKQTKAITLPLPTLAQVIMQSREFLVDKHHLQSFIICNKLQNMLHTMTK